MSTPRDKVLQVLAQTCYCVEIPEAHPLDYCERGRGIMARQGLIEPTDAERRFDRFVRKAEILAAVFEDMADESRARAVEQQYTDDFRAFERGAAVGYSIAAGQLKKLLAEVGPLAGDVEVE